MTDTQNVTAWFPRTVKPVHEGDYEVRWRGIQLLRTWRAGRWFILGSNTKATNQRIQWRGSTVPSGVIETSAEAQQAGNEGAQR